MKLVVGLGNPGFRYRNTRHNVGFLVVKKISRKSGIPIKKRKYKGLLGKGSIEGRKVALFMPQTYMNLSGEAIRQIAKKEKIETADILVIHDDIDLKFGSIRLREKGSSAGHKGLRSAINHLGTPEFPRLRIGIGKDHNIEDVVNFVLTPFNSEEKPLLKEIIEEATECALTWFLDGPAKAMANFNRRKLP